MSSLKRRCPPALAERRAWLESTGVPRDVVNQVEASRIPDDFLTRHAGQFRFRDYRRLLYLFDVMGATPAVVDAYLDAGHAVQDIEPMLLAA